MRRVTGRESAGAHRHLLTGSAVLVVGAAVQAATGGVFWLITARLETTDDVGIATALFTSVLFVSYATGLGLPVALARYASGRDRDSHVVFGWGLLVSLVSSGLGGLVYLWVVDADAADAVAAWHGLAGPLLFAAMCVGSTYSLIVDVRWMTQRRWSLVLWRIAGSGLMRFPLLVLVPDGHTAFWLFVVAMGPVALSGLLGAATLPRITGARHRLGPVPAAARDVSRFALVNWASQLAYQGPQFVLPVIVLVHVDSDVNASFYVAWGITAIALYVPMAIGQALLAEGGKGGSELRGQVRVALAVAATLMAAASVGAWALRDLVETMYGSEYGDAARVLPTLVASSVPWAFTSVYLTEARVLHRHLATIVITVVLSVGVIVPALAWVPDDGLDGAARAYLLGNVAAALVATAAHLRARSRAVPATEPDVPVAFGPAPLP